MSEYLNENEWNDVEMFRLLVNNENDLKITYNRIINPDYNTMTIDSNPIDKTIVQVYNTKFGCGFGDFIRGCITLAQCAKHFNVKFHISMEEHPISNYLKNQDYILKELSPINKKIIRCCSGCKDLYKLLSEFVKSDDKVIFVQSNLGYLVNFVTSDIKEYINNRLTFKDEYYETALEYTSQFEQYTVLHIRCFDHYIFGEYKDDNIMNKIEDLKLDTNTIVMANNYSLKKLVAETYGFYFIDKHPGHSDISYYCPELYLTVIEYIILSKSTRNVCFSYYKHGSGFSEHPSVLHNIPYQVTYVTKPNWPIESREDQYRKYVKAWNEKWDEKGF